MRVSMAISMHSLENLGFLPLVELLDVGPFARDHGSTQATVMHLLSGLALNFEIWNLFNFIPQEYTELEL